MNVDSWEDGIRRRRRTHRFKRAQTACHRCRAKKTKCDNRRPACGFCIENHAQCIYGDLPGGQSARPEPTMREIFDRIDHVATLLEFDRQLPTGASAAPGRRSSRQVLDPFAARSSSLSHRDVDSDNTLPGGPSPTRIPEVSPPAGISFESILRWPIFRGSIPDRISSLVLQTDISMDNDSPRSQVEHDMLGDGGSNTGSRTAKQSNPLVLSDEGYVPVLCQRYLKVVHVKNPVFEVSKFNMHVKKVVEHGLGWDEESCVVMLACALASTVKQVPESSDCAASSPGYCDHSACKPTEVRSSVADAYYTAAKKRLGLLDVTLTSVQCFFLAGLYEMCCMQPAGAWVHYNQACSRLQIMMAQNNLATHCQSPSFHVLERLYFSCYRTELDLREELCLPPSGIASLEFPSEFPSLPSWTSLDTANHNLAHTTASSESLPLNVVQREEEQSWYYYLACISLRKQANSIIKLLYSTGELSWTENVERVLSQAALLETELEQWRTLLPDTLRLDSDDEDTPEDLAFILECRQLHWRQISHRPLLYYALHQPETDPYYHLVLPSAQKCLDYCALTIKRLLRPHHYEGTWFIQRAIASSALLILAAQIRGAPLYVPGWESLLSLSLRALAIRESDAHDLGRARQILQRILEKISVGPD